MPSIRRSALAIEAPGLTLVYSAFPGPKRARELEFKTHEMLAEHRIKGEWFAVDAETAVKAVLQAAAALGLTLTDHENEDCRILIRTDDATKAALDALAKLERRSVSNYIEGHLQELVRQNAHLLKPKRTKK